MNWAAIAVLSEHGWKMYRLDAPDASAVIDNQIICISLSGTAGTFLCFIMSMEETAYMYIDALKMQHGGMRRFAVQSRRCKYLMRKERFI